MWGGDDPDCRKPMIWSELTYEDETTHPFGEERETNQVKFDSSLFNCYKQLIKIRNNNIELRRGGIYFLNTANENLLVFVRKYKNSKIFVIANNSDKAINYKLPNELVGLLELRSNKKFGSEINMTPY